MGENGFKGGYFACGIECCTEAEIRTLILAQHSCSRLMKVYETNGNIFLAFDYEQHMGPFSMTLSVLVRNRGQPLLMRYSRMFVRYIRQVSKAFSDIA